MKISNAVTRAKRPDLSEIVRAWPSFVTVQMAIEAVNARCGVNLDAKVETIDPNATYSWGAIYDTLKEQGYEPFVSHHGPVKISGFRRAG